MFIKLSAMASSPIVNGSLRARGVVDPLAAGQKMRHVVRRRVVAAPIVTVLLVMGCAATLATLDWLDSPAKAAPFRRGSNEVTRASMSLGTRWVLALQAQAAAPPGAGKASSRGQTRAGLGATPYANVESTDFGRVGFTASR